MPTELSWSDMGLRLFLAVIAGALFGINRGEQGHPAGLRTTMLVCLAAAISMLQVNLLLNTDGKSPTSFVVMDLMRLPLGILSGMGFIGAGAILRKGSLITGVTTAATLWFVTVMGLCLGGGQWVLGLIALVLGLLILWGLKIVEAHWHQEHMGKLTVISGEGLAYEEISHQVQAAGGKVLSWSYLSHRKEEKLTERTCEVAWKIRPSNPKPPSFLSTLRQTPSVSEVIWKI